MVRQLSNETDRVRNEGLEPLAQFHRTGGGIERREQAVLDKEVGTGKRAEQ